MRRASRLNRSSSVKHGGLSELQGSKGRRTKKNKTTQQKRYLLPLQNIKLPSKIKGLKFCTAYMYFTAHNDQVIDANFNHKIVLAQKSERRVCAQQLFFDSERSPQK